MTAKIDCARCEFNWWLGRAGTCDEGAGICICPSGFSGRDDFFIDNEICNVNETLARNMNIVVSIFYGLSFLTALICSIVLTTRFLYHKRRSTNTSVHYEKIRKIRLMTTVGMFLLAVGSLFLVFYHNSLIARKGDLLKPTVEDGEISRLIIGAVGSFFVVAGLLGVVGSWYASLPSPVQFAKLLKYDKAFINTAIFLDKFGVFLFFLSISYPFITYLVIPFAATKKQEYKIAFSYFAIVSIFAGTSGTIIALVTLKNAKRAFNLGHKLLQFE